MINRVVLVGRLTKDPELRHTASNIPVVSFTVAINRTYAKSESDQQADYIQCVAWRRQAETIHQFLNKGSLVGVEGRIQTRTYDDPNGQRKYITEVLADSVQFLEPKSAQASRPSYDNNPASNSKSPYDYQTQNTNDSNHYPENNDDPVIDIPDDDLPF